MSNKITMPWEERPAGCKDVMWRYSENPVIDRYHIPSSNSIFNSAVVPLRMVMPVCSVVTTGRCR